MSAKSRGLSAPCRLIHSIRFYRKITLKMNRFIFLLVAVISFHTFAFADEELDERLKAVMLLFDKKHSELTVQIGQLDIENQKLKIESEKLRSHNQALIAENQSLRKQLGLTSEKQVETAASPKNLEALQDYPSSASSTNDAALETNINVASQLELELLPGVGPVIAQRIIDSRPYPTVDDLLKVRGIGKTSIEILRSLVRVE